MTLSLRLSLKSDERTGTQLTHTPALKLHEGNSLKEIKESRNSRDEGEGPHITTT